MSENNTKHERIIDSIEALHITRSKTKELLNRITCEEPVSGDANVKVKQSLSTVLLESPNEILSLCKEIDDILEDINGELF